MDKVKIAKQYLAWGWNVLPMVPFKKVPYVKWKPFQKRMATEQEVEKWFTDFKDANFGIITGKISNLCALDWDAPDAKQRFEKEVGCKLPETKMQDTGRGSQSLFAYNANGYKLKNQAGIIPDVDFRGEAGLIVVPPSIHKNGKQYRWREGCDTLSDLPPKVAKYLHDKQQEKKTTAATATGGDKEPDWVTKAMDGVNKGQRDVTMTRLAGYWLRDQKGDKERTFAILSAVDLKNNPPLGEDIVREKIESVASRQGIEELGLNIGFGISQLELIKYQDKSDPIYRFFVADEDVPIHCGPKDICDPNRFRVKLLTLTNRIMPEIKRADFWDLIQAAINEATIINAGIEETAMGQIVTIINQDLTREFQEPEKMVHVNAVLYNGTVVVKIPALINSLDYTPYKGMNQKEVGAILRKLHFENKPIKINGEPHRAWCCSYEDFKKWDDDM
jgi:hypothetical protein